MSDGTVDQEVAAYKMLGPAACFRALKVEGAEGGVEGVGQEERRAL